MIPVSGDSWELPDEVRPDLVIHAAGRLFGRERTDYFRTNVGGSLQIAAQLPDHARMIVLSSLAAGGPTPQGVDARTITHADAPVSYYGASKLAMEGSLREKLGARLLILRPPMVLGPRDAATVPLFQMAKGFLRVKPGLRPKHYSWIAVEDLCEALLSAASNDWAHPKPLYLASDQTITDAQLLATAAEVIRAKGLTLPLPHAVIRGISRVLDLHPSWREAVPSLGLDRVREILPERWVCESGHFGTCFDWKPRRELAETLRATAEHLKAVGKL
jgi:nucleoside-diphosphate-sugar epimerase